MSHNKKIMDLLMVLARIWDFFFYTALPFVVVLGIMIFVHELGHYLAARALGVRVLMFKLGFGRYILSWKRGHTEYGIGWIPIGGYVKMFGDPTEVEGGEEDVPLEEIPEQDRAEALYFRPASHKLITFFAGPLMNIALAFILAPALFMLGVPEIAPVVGMIEPDSPAQVAGIEPGDRVVSIDGKRVHSYSDMEKMEKLNPGRSMTYVIERKGQRIETEVAIRKGEPEPMGESGIIPSIPWSVGEVVSGSPAEAAGIQTGDKVLAIDGDTISLWDELYTRVGASQGREMELLLRRGERKFSVRLTPRLEQEADRFIIGIIRHDETELIKYGLGAAIVKGAAFSVEQVELLFQVLWKLVSHQLSPKLMAGPLGIGAMTGQMARSGAAPLIGFMVLITVNLGILNLLPFPPLDGGHILFTSLEWVARREINIVYKEWVFRVGMVLLLTLMVLVTFNDFLRYKSRMGDFFIEIFKGLGLG